jgi:hypothetical protein
MRLLKDEINHLSNLIGRHGSLEKAKERTKHKEGSARGKVPRSKTNFGENPFV